ncbi:MAG: aminotransferase class V-fold PLP-dependent enzyme, partial [Bdellovibrionales bacterium]|nr:aminotransferase class V-fold PLP-dependent enzyme [Bdellovibrionales bacterium]
MSRRRSLKAILGYAGSAAFVSCTHGPLYSKKDNSNESTEFSPETVDSRDRVTKGQALVDLEQNTLTNWELIKALFPLDPQRYHFSGFVLSSHPEPVGRMINQLRLEFDRDPMRAKDSYGHYFGRLRTSASAYLETNFRNIGFTDSTTMGLALLYSGVKLKKDQEVLVCDHDFYSTKESLKLRASRTGANVRYYQLYKSIDAVSEDEILSNIRSNIRPSTRVLALTWVHSDTGLKLPIKLISQLVDEANRSRSFHDRLIMCVDGVHGMGVEALTPSQLGCDFFVAGTHKALFGPRGTGVIWAKDSNWPSSYVEATIPPFFKSRFFGE